MLYCCKSINCLLPHNVTGLMIKSLDEPNSQLQVSKHGGQEAAKTTLTLLL